MFLESKAVPQSKGNVLKRPLHLVDFFCFFPKATAVSLVGDFNGWDATANPMQRRPDGGWWLRMSLNHGHHKYCFLVDGKPMLDQRALGTVRNEIGQPVSLIAVS